MNPVVVHLCPCGEPVEFAEDTLCAYCLANTPKEIEPWPEIVAIRSGLEHAERGMRVELDRLRSTLDRMADVLHNSPICLSGNAPRNAHVTQAALPM